MPSKQHFETSDSLDAVAELSQQLWLENSHPDLLTKFVELARDHLHLARAGLFSISEAGVQRGLDRSEVTFKGVPTFDDKFVETMESSLLKVNLRSPECAVGLNHYHLEGRNLYFTLIGRQEAREILIWELDPAMKSSPALERVGDFLARQLQNGCGWLGRMSETQAQLFRDDLTGLFNVRFLETTLDNEIRRAQRFQMNFCLLFIDLDNFKMINDKFGHLAGSSVLKQVAHLLVDTSREVDSVVRFGGDEFIVLLLGAKPTMGILAAERIRKRIEESAFYLEDGAHVSLTASIGVAAFPDHAKDKTSLMNLADECMYQGKKNGKNRVTLFRKEKAETAGAAISKQGS